MKQIIPLVFAILLSGSLSAQKAYEVAIDLNKVDNDQLAVSMLVPKIRSNDVEFQIPKIVPGTYAIYNFGRFINNFKALDKKGRGLPVTKLSSNRWKIEKAKKLKKITYWVEDTWDTNKDTVVFEPAGTNIEEGKNFILNTHGFFGYLKDMKDLPYQVEVTYPKGFYGATSLPLKKREQQKDIYYIDNYVNLVDAPIMYCIPDTTTLNVGGAEILVSVYSPNNKLTSKDVMKEVKEILFAQKEYLGGSLPIKKYAFIIYLFGNMASNSGSFGALEHSYSSLYALPEADPKFLAQTIRDVAAHEFFHIVTPLNIHAEEIHYFDFISPKMSKHLWLYEGMTEYSAGHVQIMYKLFSLEDYLDEIKKKIIHSKQFNDTLPFTELSTYCLNEHKDQYINVYAKGALIGLCLDIRLRELSNGKYGVQNLMKDLAKNYGKDKPFKDEELFDKIAELTYPQVRDFFTKYVEGSEPIPYGEFLDKVGLIYMPKNKEKQVSLGKLKIGYNPESQRIFVREILALTTFGEEVGLAEDDEIISINGEEIGIANATEAILGIKKMKNGEPLTIVVMRKNDDGENKEVTLEAKAQDSEVVIEHYIAENPDASAEQLVLRKAWINQ